MYKYWSHVMLAVLIATNIGLVTKLAVAQINAPGNAAAFVSMQVPSSIAAGEKGTVTVTFKNTGSKTWRSADNYYVGSVCPSRDRIDMFMGDIGSRAALTSDVQPGQEVSISFSVQSNTAGTFSVCYQMVQEGVEWFGDVSATNTISVRTDSGGGTSSSSSVQASSTSSSSTPITPPSALGNNATFISMSEIPSQLPVGRSFPVGITYRNTGKTIWTMTNMYRLGSQSPQDNTIWNLLVGGSRIDIEPGSTNSMSVVKPGESVNFFFVITPKKTGTYDFQMKMVQDGKEWFGNPTPKKTIKVIEDSTIAKNNAEFVSLSGVPQSMNVNDTAVVSVKMRNSGNTTWTKKDLYGLGSQSPQDNVIWGGGRAPLSDSVKPSDDATFTFKIHAPEKTGKYAFQWKMVQDGKEWFGEASPLQTITVVDPNANAFNFANFVSITGMPATMAPSQTATVTVTAKNTGTTTWASQKGYYLGSQNPQDNLTWGTSRVALPKPVAPGEQVTFSFQVRAPQKTGTYPFHWRMVQDGKEWFGNAVSTLPVVVANNTSYTTPLVIAVKAIGTQDIATKNQKNINLLRFDGYANENRDVLLTDLIFASESGSLTNAQNYTLWVDTNNNGQVDTILQTGVNSQSSRINFSRITGGGYVIPKGKTVTFEVHADIAPSLSNNWLMLRFLTSDSTFIGAEYVDTSAPLTGIKLNGACTGQCDIAVTTSPSQLYKIVNQGNLYVSKDTTPLKNRQLLAGTLGDSILRLNFHADYEDIDVTDLQLTSSGGTATSIDRLELYKEGSLTPFAHATVEACGSDDVLTRSSNKTVTTFCAKMQGRQLIVTKGMAVKVLVKPRLKSDTEGAVSGDIVQLFITKQPVMNNAMGSGAVRARGDISSNNLGPNNGNMNGDGEIFIGLAAPSHTNNDIVGIKNMTVLSKMASIINASPDADGSMVPTGISDIGQFKFTAATNSNVKNGLNTWTLTDVIFTLNATNITFDPQSLKVYNKANATVKSNCFILDSSPPTSLYRIACWNIRNAGVNTAIDSGADMTLVLQANITDRKVSPFQLSVLNVSLDNFSDAARVGIGSHESHIRWLDTDSTQSQSFLWVDSPETTIKSTSYQN